MVFGYVTKFLLKLITLSIYRPAAALFCRSVKNMNVIVEKLTIKLMYKAGVFWKFTVANIIDIAH